MGYTVRIGRVAPACSIRRVAEHRNGITRCASSSPRRTSLAASPGTYSQFYISVHGLYCGN